MNNAKTSSRVLIANRGAVACRIQRTLRELGMEPVVVYHESDRESLHVQQTRHRYSLGDGSVAETYLNQEAILRIALESGAWAIHPGYGFLSENADFVRRCESAGLVFLGPTAEQIEVFGLKHKARELARKYKVPVLPGSGILQSCEDALVHARQIGYPVILKSSAGGGGIGMAVCGSEDALARAWDSVTQISQNNFSDGSLFLEKYIEQARHIEVQVFGDGCGGAISLGERDCSAQRRNQKVIEETPAPNLTDAVRKHLHSTARTLLSAVEYRSAGTVEFLFDATSEGFFLLEVNTRLQVEHGVTEMVWSVDLVRWMVELGAGQLAPLVALERDLRPQGHAIQARLYAEDPGKSFQPSAGLLTEVLLPPAEPRHLRVDHWIESGVEVSPLFDPMLGKIIAHGHDRNSALEQLTQAVWAASLRGIETNLSYLRALLASQPLRNGSCLTSTLAGFSVACAAVDVLSGGTMTTVQDFPGRTGYWGVGVPPSGPFDSLGFRLGNRLLGNPEDAAGLEITLDGPQLRFRCASRVVLAGAPVEAELDGAPVQGWRIIPVSAGQVLRIYTLRSTGMRAYLLFAGGIDCPAYLGSRATFTLGRFGGHGGRAVRTGDVLHLLDDPAPGHLGALPPALIPAYEKQWVLRVTPGPQGTSEYFTANYLDTFYSTEWRVHYNSSRTGVRLLGPKPEWAREDGGEAGMHPSNIHDNAYAVGTIDFTGDMPVILGPDGPSLGGFVCAATVASVDLWKLGQLAAGDSLRFEPVTLAWAYAAQAAQERQVETLSCEVVEPVAQRASFHPEIHHLDANGVEVTVRRSGDAWLLVEYGPPVLDIRLRFHAHRLMLSLQENPIPGVLDLTPGIRSLQIHYTPISSTDRDVTESLIERISAVAEQSAQPVRSRIIHLPLSWDDPVCREAIDKYQRSVRRDAPWYPSNIEFIRRINGLDSVEELRRIVFEASYLVMGLGDVYLGAPVATPLDPRHRLVTTKYNPARTWTAENSVGIGGSYLCVYGMEGPGGYQFVGRTLQMWNRYRKTADFTRPWLLKFFDQLRFYEVSDDELKGIRADFLVGNYQLQVEESEFDLGDYEHFLESQRDSIRCFEQGRQVAFDTELAAWKAKGQFHFEQQEAPQAPMQASMPAHYHRVESPVSGSVWRVTVDTEQKVAVGDCMMILESMKMEIEIQAPVAGTVRHIAGEAGTSVRGGQALVYLEPES